jgi:hypothetical protein
MSDQLGEEVPAETVPAWDSVRRVREPLAWAALIFTVAVLRLRALRPLTPQYGAFGEDDEDFGEDG